MGRARIAAAGLGGLLLAVGSCGHENARVVVPGAPLVAVLAPSGGENDAIGTLVDGTVDDEGWYCSHARPPLHFEVMTADGEARAIRAVGFVPGNLGPDGVGPVSVRVQLGHGVASRGRLFNATVRAHNNDLVVLELPEAVRGDHVVLSWLHGSSWRTAACIGEVVVYDATQPIPSPSVRVAATPAPESAPTAVAADAGDADVGDGGDASVAPDADASADASPG